MRLRRTTYRGVAHLGAAGCCWTPGARHWIILGPGTTAPVRTEKRLLTGESLDVEHRLV